MYRPQQIVIMATHYQPQEDGTCKQTVYKVLISNVVDGRSLYREITAFDAFRSRELKRAYPNKHRTIEWTSLEYDLESWERFQQGNERCGLPRAVIHKEVGPTWWKFLEEINYDRKKHRYGSVDKT